MKTKRKLWYQGEEHKELRSLLNGSPTQRKDNPLININITSKEKSLVSDALKEYEENHYASEDIKWQKTINKLLDIFKGD